MVSLSLVTLSEAPDRGALECPRGCCCELADVLVQRHKWVDVVGGCRA